MRQLLTLTNHESVLVANLSLLFLVEFFHVIWTDTEIDNFIQKFYPKVLLLLLLLLVVLIYNNNESVRYSI